MRCTWELALWQLVGERGDTLEFELRWEGNAVCFGLFARRRSFDTAAREVYDFALFMSQLDGPGYQSFIRSSGPGSKGHGRWLFFFDRVALVFPFRPVMPLVNGSATQTIFCSEVLFWELPRESSMRFIGIGIVLPRGRR